MFYILSSFFTLVILWTLVIMKMTKIILNEKLQNYNCNVNEEIVMFLVPKLIMCIINGLTSLMKSQ
jgi:hypothetical protein